MKQNVFKYNKLGNLSAVYLAYVQILYTYFYKSGYRKETITHKNNKSNFKTITKQIYNFQDNKWKNISRIELGEKYNTYYRYDSREIFTRRFNKVANTLFIKHLISGEDNAEIWVINYNGKKSIGFKSNPNNFK